MAQTVPSGDNILLRDAIPVRKIGRVERFLGPENYRILQGLMKTPASITGFALVLFFVGKYAPTVAEDINFVIAALQPVFVSIIIAISIEDAAEKSTGSAG